MKRMILMALVSMMVLLTGCSSDSDEITESPSATIESALVGTWLEKSDDLLEINQAMVFEQNGVTMYLQPQGSTVRGGWYFGEFTSVEKGKINMDVIPINVKDFKSFDNFEWWAADPYHAYWEFTYSISGNVLTITLTNTGKTLTLTRD